MGRETTHIRKKNLGGRKLLGEEKISYEADFFSRQPATNPAIAPKSHSIRHNWIACQSRAVRTVKMIPTAKAPTRQNIPNRNAARAGFVSPKRTPSAANSAKPGISTALWLVSSRRLVPQW